MRSVRVDDDSWELARLRAALEDRPIAWVIRNAIRKYVGGPVVPASQVLVGESGPEVGQQKGGNAWEAEEPDVVNQGPASPSVMPKPAKRVPVANIARPDQSACSHPKSARKMVNGGPFCAPSLGGCGAVIP